MNRRLKGICAAILSLTLLTTALTACGKKIERADNSAAGQQYINSQNGIISGGDNNAVQADGNNSGNSVNSSNNNSSGGGLFNHIGGNSSSGSRTGKSSAATPDSPTDSSSSDEPTANITDNSTSTTTKKSSIFDRFSRTTTTTTTTQSTSRTTRPITSNPVDAQRVLNSAPLSPMLTNDSELDAMIGNLISSLTTPDMTTYQKVCSIYNHFVINYRYGFMPLKETESGYYSLYDADVVGRSKNFLKYKTGICIDFSAAFMAVMRRIGLNFYLISGQVVNKYGDSSFHGWTVLRVNGNDYGFDPEADFRYSNGNPAHYWNFCVDDQVKFNPGYTNMAQVAFMKFRTL